jgi:quercetin dioxygenase-like cupin family protein
MRLAPAGHAPSQAGPSEWFTGRVRIDPLCRAESPGTVQVNTVTFEPGARTHWHTHPRGQTLLVTAGRGLVCAENERAREIRPGDTVWIPAGERHWHGAAADTAMSHVAIQEAEDGETTRWLEPVTDAEYAAR